MAGKSGPAFAELAPGLELEPLTKGPVTRQHLVEWCAAESDYLKLHYDQRAAERAGLPGPPIQGTYRYAVMALMIERWLGGAGVLRRITANYRGVDLEDDTITARGTVKSLEPNADGGGTAVVDVWIENQRGERSTSGEATVELLA